MNGKISNEKLDKIRNSNPIEDVISEYMNIHKKGKNYSGICPFHADTSPSLIISPEKQIFKCFACGTGGNVFSFIQKYKSIPFLETVRELANRANIDISELKTIKNETSYDSKTIKIFELNNEALLFFKYNLQNNDQALKFASTRNIDKSIIEKFEIGFAPRNTSLVNFLVNKGFEKSEIIFGGLATQRDNGEVVDIFFNRLMFPIKNIDSKIIGFSGRVIDEGVPKYLNSPETYIFKKSELLYNIEKAKSDMKCSKEVYVTEGFMDVIALSKIGVNNSVAIMGTNMSLLSIKLLKKITKKIILSLDNDLAGQKATIESSIKLLKENIRTDILFFNKKHKDMDELISNEDINFVQKELKIRLTPIEFNIKLLQSSLDLNLVNNKKTFLKEISTLLSLENDDICRESYLKSISSILNIDVNTIRKNLKLKISSNEVNEYVANNITVDVIKNSIEKIVHIYDGIEKSLLKHCIKSYDVYNTIKKEKYEIWWKKRNKMIFHYIDNYYLKNNIINIEMFLDEIQDEDIKEQIISLIDQDMINDVKTTIYSKDETKEWLNKLNEQDELKKFIL